MNLLKTTTKAEGQMLPAIPTETNCKIIFKSFREERGIVCKKCKCKKHYYLKSKWQWQCRKCGFRTTLRSGTALENTKLSFQHWFRAILYLAEYPEGVSAKELQRSLGFKRYQPAWSMLHKIRRATFPLPVGMNSKKNPDKVELAKLRRSGKVGVFYRRKFTMYANLNIRQEKKAPYTFSKRMIPREIPGATGVFRSLESRPHKRIRMFWQVIRKVHHLVSDKYLQNYMDFISFSMQIGRHLESRSNRILQFMVV